MENILQNLIVVFAAKRWSTTKHYIHNYSHGPVVALSCIRSFQHLRCDVVRSTIWSSHEFVLRNFLSEPKVYQLDMRIIIFLIEQKVLWLNVPVANI